MDNMLLKGFVVCVALLLMAGCGQSKDAEIVEAMPSVGDTAAKPTVRASDSPSASQHSVRFATFNVSLFRDKEGGLKQAILAGDDPQMQAVADIIKRVQPDVLLLAEFDFDRKGESLFAFRDAYLGKEIYPHILAIPSNTGVSSGIDLNGDGKIVTKPGSRDYGGDAFGFGRFPGQYGFALVSKYPIDRANIRSFQKFKWQDMPDNAMPAEFYNADASSVFRLSSKNHVDIPVLINGSPVHIIAAHPTPPVFDGPEDRNGRRNNDEIRLLADYITPGAGDYLVDDQGRAGGLGPEQRFIVMGDLNADPIDGDIFGAGIGQLLDNPMIEDVVPSSAGAAAASLRQGGVNMSHNLPADQDTSDFADKGSAASGNMRLDYVLPSKFGLLPTSSGIFWPEEEADGFGLVGDGHPVISSDHRLVWVDIVVE